MKIAVIGAGIIGLSTAVAISEKYRSAPIDVTLFAESFSPNTTGDGSAGFISPYILGNTLEPLVS